MSAGPGRPDPAERDGRRGLALVVGVLLVLAAARVVAAVLP